MTSRPDIEQAAHVFSAFLENPGEQHWIAAKRVLRYLKETAKDRLVYSRSPDCVCLEGFSDADRTGNEDH